MNRFHSGNDTLWYNHFIYHKFWQNYKVWTLQWLIVTKRLFQTEDRSWLDLWVSAARSNLVTILVVTPVCKVRIWPVLSSIFIFCQIFLLVKIIIFTYVLPQYYCNRRWTLVAGFLISLWTVWGRPQKTWRCNCHNKHCMCDCIDLTWACSTLHSRCSQSIWVCWQEGRGSRGQSLSELRTRTKTTTEDGWFLLEHNCAEGLPTLYG